MTSPQPSTTPPLRASDDDRTAVVRALHAAVARGLLTLEECDERVTAAYAARHLRELPPLTADLPSAAPPGPVAPGWRAIAVLLWLQLRTLLRWSTWRDVARAARMRPRLAAAVVGLLAVLMLGAVTLGEISDHGPDGPRIEHAHGF